MLASCLTASLDPLATPLAVGASAGKERVLGSTSDSTRTAAAAEDMVGRDLANRAGIRKRVLSRAKGKGRTSSRAFVVATAPVTIAFVTADRNGTRGRTSKAPPSTRSRRWRSTEKPRPSSYAPVTDNSDNRSNEEVRFSFTAAVVPFLAIEIQAT